MGGGRLFFFFLRESLKTNISTTPVMLPLFNKFYVRKMCGLDRPSA